jgi:DNA invertase Pin-like site-specific DNA recombinase
MRPLRSLLDRSPVGREPDTHPDRGRRAIRLDLVRVFEDEGISGAKGRDKRPGFDALLKAIHRREIDVAAGHMPLTVWDAP